MVSCDGATMSSSAAGQTHAAQVLLTPADRSGRWRRMIVSKNGSVSAVLPGLANFGRYVPRRGLSRTTHVVALAGHFRRSWTPPKALVTFHIS